ncbi:hypothetical protein DIPPA_32020 [Diplonema papillatum]|nr:hypothetical protein DIPPA_32020 [Diplonema papillatum]
MPPDTNILETAAPSIVPPAATSAHSPPNNTSKAPNATPTPNVVPSRVIIVEEKELTSVSAGMSPFAKGNGITIAVLQKFGCQVEDIDLETAKKLDWEFHPTQIPIGTGDLRYMIGALVMNPVLFFSFVLLLLLGTKVAQKTLTLTFHEATALLRFPSILYIPLTFLLPGTSLISVQVMFSSHSSAEVCLGAVVALACVACPVTLYFTVVREMPKRILYMKDPKLYPEDVQAALLMEEAGLNVAPDALKGWRKAAYRFAFGDYVALSRMQDRLDSERLGFFCDSYRPGHSACACFELGMGIAIAGFSGWQTSDLAACSVRNVLICLVVFAMAVYLAVVRPFSSKVDNLMACTMVLLMLTAVILMTIDILRGEEPGSGLFVPAAWLLFFSMLLVVLQAVINIVLYLYGVWMNRRAWTHRLDKTFAAPKLSFLESRANTAENSQFTRFEELDDFTGQDSDDSAAMYSSPSACKHHPTRVTSCGSLDALSHSVDNHQPRQQSSPSASGSRKSSFRVTEGEPLARCIAGGSFRGVERSPRVSSLPLKARANSSRSDSLYTASGMRSTIDTTPLSNSPRVRSDRRSLRLYQHPCSGSSYRKRTIANHPQPTAPYTSLGTTLPLAFDTWGRMNDSPKLPVARGIDSPKLAALPVTDSPKLAALRIDDSPKFPALRADDSPKLAALRVNESPKLAALRVINDSPKLAALRMNESPSYASFRISECVRATPLRAMSPQVRSGRLSV